jgi:elongation factor G
VFPEPVLALVLEPRATADRDRLRDALSRLAREDPSLRVVEDESSGQWTVEGMGELHLEIVQHRLTKEFHVDCAVGPPRVAYREAPSVAARGKGRVERQMGGKDVFGALEITLEPDPAARAEGLSPVLAWDPRVEVAAALRGPIEEALQAAASTGPRFGYPLVGARLRIVGAESRPGQDAATGFVQAAHIALREALEGSEVQLLEPLMQLEVLVPDEHSSSVIADLGTRHAEVEGVQSQGSDRLVRGSVPLARMFGYSTAVRSLSQGRAGFSLVPAGYRVVPEQELVERGLTWS